MSLKTIILGPIIILALISVASASEAAQTNGPGNGTESIAALLENPAILKDEIVVAKENGTRVEWRHIVVKGNNTQIGMALGQIAQEDYGAKSLFRYADPIYGKARQVYMERNFPAMSERMKGIAAAYGIPSDNYTFDASTLAYDVGSVACSMIYFPPENTENGHALASRNTDWYLVPMDVYLNKTTNATGNAACSRNFILEIYPDEGYSTIAVGSSDLNSALDIVNSEGLGISLLEDTWLDPIPKTPIAGGRNSGIAGTQVPRLISETCKTVEEAKLEVLANKEFFSLVGTHYMVYDSYGNSTIIEWNKTDGSIYFTDGVNGKPNIMTNHPMYLFSNYAIKDLPRESNLIPYNDPYDSFNRYITLHNFTSSHQGKFSEGDASDALSLVFADTVIAAEGAMMPLPINTIYNVLLDVTDKSVKAKFYLKNGPVDPETGKNTTIYSEYFTFKLENSTEL